MRSLVTASFFALSLSVSGAATAACEQPVSPTLPDGKSATLEQMIAAQKAVKGFQADNAEYRICIEKDLKKSEKAAKKAKGDDKASAEAAHQALVDGYNSAVDQEEKVAAEFNAQIGAFNAANPN